MTTEDDKSAVGPCGPISESTQLLLVLMSAVSALLYFLGSYAVPAHFAFLLKNLETALTILGIS